MQFATNHLGNISFIIHDIIVLKNVLWTWTPIFFTFTSSS